MSTAEDRMREAFDALEVLDGDIEIATNGCNRPRGRWRRPRPTR